MFANARIGSQIPELEQRRLPVDGDDSVVVGAIGMGSHASASQSPVSGSRTQQGCHQAAGGIAVGSEFTINGSELHQGRGASNPRPGHAGFLLKVRSAKGDCQGVEDLASQWSPAGEVGSTSPRRNRTARWCARQFYGVPRRRSGRCDVDDVQFVIDEHRSGRTTLRASYRILRCGFQNDAASHEPNPVDA